MPRGRERLSRVIFRVWQRTQSAYTCTQEEYELGAITLRFLGLIRRGETATLDTATYAAFGCAFDVWQSRTAERIWRLNAEVVEAGRLGRQPEAERVVYPMSPAARSSVKKPVLEMPPPRTGTE